MKAKTSTLDPPPSPLDVGGDAYAGLRKSVTTTSRADPTHVCLVPVRNDKAARVLFAEADHFKCACGETFPARLATDSWTTEYERRCLKCRQAAFVQSPTRKV